MTTSARSESAASNQQPATDVAEANLIRYCANHAVSALHSSVSRSDATRRRSSGATRGPCAAAAGRLVVDPPGDARFVADSAPAAASEWRASARRRCARRGVQRGSLPCGGACGPTAARDSTWPRHPIPDARGERRSPSIPPTSARPDVIGRLPRSPRPETIFTSRTR